MDFIQTDEPETCVADWEEQHYIPTIGSSEERGDAQRFLIYTKVTMKYANNF